MKILKNKKRSQITIINKVMMNKFEKKKNITSSNHTYVSNPSCMYE